MADDALANPSPTPEETTPSEADFAAIHDVFMETARGRWFLAEFVRRNRNADTRMVLDAVARIERSLAQPRDGAPDPAVAWAAVREIVTQARHEVEATLHRQQPAEQFAAAYRSVRTVREIAWTLRECGADAGVCDGLDTQANAIDRHLDHLAASAPADAVTAVFDELIRRMDELADGSALPAPQDDASPPLATTQNRVEAIAPPVVSAQPRTERAFSSDVEAGSREPAASPAEADLAPEIADDMARATTQAPPPPEPDSSIAPIKDDIPATAEDAIAAAAEEAHDLAVLDRIALEMAADDTGDIDEGIANCADDAALDIADDDAADARSLDDAFDFRKEPPASLGAAVIASGSIRPRGLPGTGRFAAIERLSQAEKVALFS